MGLNWSDRCRDPCYRGWTKWRSFDSVWKRIFTCFLCRKAWLWFSSAKSFCFFAEGGLVSHLLSRTAVSSLVSIFTAQARWCRIVFFFVLSMSAGAVTTSVTDQGSPGTSKSCYFFLRDLKDRARWEFYQSTSSLCWFPGVFGCLNDFGLGNCLWSMIADLGTRTCQPAYQHFDPLL